jgi:hypothetical protein
MNRRTRVALILAAATALGSLAFIPAANAQNSPALSARASLSSSLRLNPQAATATPAATACAIGSRTYNRFSACLLTTGSVTFLVDDEPVGEITFLVDQTDLLAVKSTSITEEVYIHDIAAEGETEPTDLGVTATCGTGCKGSAHAPVALVADESYHYDLHFTNTIAANAARFNTPTYDWEFSTGGVSTTRGEQWRCDDKLNQRAGCVYASFIPTITTMAGLKFIAPNIRSVQARGGPKELHRNSLLTSSNRTAACNIKLPAGWKPPAGWPLPITDLNNKPTCDEYPFAGTWEGGKRLPASQRGTAWVPYGENSSQGGLLNAFYLANRVLNATSKTTKGDAFYVVP